MKLLIVLFFSFSFFYSYAKTEVSEKEKLKNVKRYYHRGYQDFRRRHIMRHPLMTSLAFDYEGHFFKVGVEKGKRKYPFTINLYSDVTLKNKVGEITFSLTGEINRYEFPEIRGEVRYKNEIKCVYAYNTDTCFKGGKEMSYSCTEADLRWDPNAKVCGKKRNLAIRRSHKLLYKWDGHGSGERSMLNCPKQKSFYMRGGCDFINFYYPYIEVNEVLGNSYKIMQEDGSAIYISKKEFEPYHTDNVGERDEAGWSKTVLPNRETVKKKCRLTDAQIDKVYDNAEAWKKDLMTMPMNDYLKKYDKFYKKNNVSRKDAEAGWKILRPLVENQHYHAHSDIDWNGCYLLRGNGYFYGTKEEYQNRFELIDELPKRGSGGFGFHISFNCKNKCELTNIPMLEGLIFSSNKKVYP